MNETPEDRWFRIATNEQERALRAEAQQGPLIDRIVDLEACLFAISDGADNPRELAAAMFSEVPSVSETQDSSAPATPGSKSLGCADPQLRQQGDTRIVATATAAQGPGSGDGGERPALLPPGVHFWRDIKNKQRTSEARTIDPEAQALVDRLIEENTPPKGERRCLWSRSPEAEPAEQIATRYHGKSDHEMAWGIIGEFCAALGGGSIADCLGRAKGLRTDKALPEPLVCTVCGCAESNEHVWTEVEVCRGCYEGKRYHVEVLEEEAVQRNRAETARPPSDAIRRWAEQRIETCRTEERKFADAWPESKGKGPSRALVEAWTERRTLQQLIERLEEPDGS